MTGRGHYLTGIGAGLIAAALCLQGVPGAAFALALPGATAPDWLELPYAQGKRLIVHRTITHWLPLWLIALAWAWFHRDTWAGSMTMGFVVGGLMHLLMDWPNPKGIPVLTPWRRISLKLWKSGQNEGLLVGISWGMGWMALRLAGAPV